MKVAVCPPFSFIFGLAEKGVPSESTNHLARHYNHLFVDSKNLLMRMQKGSVRFSEATLMFKLLFHAAGDHDGKERKQALWKNTAIIIRCLFRANGGFARTEASL